MLRLQTSTFQAFDITGILRLGVRENNFISWSCWFYFFMQVKSSAVLNFETQNVYRLAINVTDNGLPPLSMVKAISVQIIDVNEPPETLSLDNSKVGWKYTCKDEERITS